jgi:hypothetical protein
LLQAYTLDARIGIAAAGEQALYPASIYTAAMAKILLANHWGGGAGHARRFRVVADALREAGHSPVLNAEQLLQAVREACSDTRRQERAAALALELSARYPRDPLPELIADLERML